MTAPAKKGFASSVTETIRRRRNMHKVLPSIKVQSKYEVTPYIEEADAPVKGGNSEMRASN